MPRGYRRIILAAAGFLILGNTEQHPRSHQNRQGQQATPPAPKQQPNAREDRKPTQGCQGTTQPKLSCDEIAAQAAVDQARDADKQAAIAVWQTGVGAFTLIVAVAAAFFAERAAAHTKRSANAAQESNRTTKQIGEAQVRAYLSIGEASLSFTANGVPEIAVEIVNSGQSTARNVHWIYDLQLIGGPGEWEPPVFRPRARWIGDIAAGKAKCSNLECATLHTGGEMFGPVSEGDLPKLFGAAFFITATIKLDWTDVFDGPWNIENIFHPTEPADDRIRPGKAMALQDMR